jgi:hypothetical protein
LNNDIISGAESASCMDVNPCANASFMVTSKYSRAVVSDIGGLGMRSIALSTMMPRQNISAPSDHLGHFDYLLVCHHVVQWCPLRSRPGVCPSIQVLVRTPTKRVHRHGSAQWVGHAAEAPDQSRPRMKCSPQLFNTRETSENEQRWETAPQAILFGPTPYLRPSGLNHHEHQDALGCTP